MNELNFRLLCQQADEVSEDEDILWIDDIIITPIKKPGMKERILLWVFQNNFQDFR